MQACGDYVAAERTIGYSWVEMRRLTAIRDELLRRVLSGVAHDRHGSDLEEAVPQPNRRIKSS
jgi:hypothetical protein